MTTIELLRLRLGTQSISPVRLDSPAQVVSSLGAVQAQDYLGALWGIGLRMRTGHERDVEKALAERSIVRTWPMRGTLHFVAAEDVRWMLSLLTPRIVARNAKRLERDYSLTGKVFQRSAQVLSRAMSGSRQLTRAAVYQTLESARIPTANQRGLHILWRLAQDGLLCFGPREGKQQTFVLLDEWIPSSAGPGSRDESLAAIAHRYFIGHGPASIHDFAWWSGLAPADARKAVELAKSELQSVNLDDVIYYFGFPPVPPVSHPSAHLLPAYDEYLVGYQDRSGVLAAKHKDQVNVLLGQTVVIDGTAVGTWKRTLTRDRVHVDCRPFARLNKIEASALERAVDHYRAFLES